MFSRFGIVAAFVAGSVHALGGQASALMGTVVRDTLGHALGGGVEVRIPQINSGGTTNYMGEFRITRIPPGRYLVNIRSVGYEPFSDSITFVANQAVTREFVLKPIATQLDPVQTQAAGAQKYRSPALNGFEERRLAGKGGYFIADSALARRRGRAACPMFWAAFLDCRRCRIAPPRTSRRRAMGRTAVSWCFAGKKGGMVFCYVTIYVDGVMRWRSPSSTTNPPFDLNTINVSDIAGAEFYAGGASMPVQYNATGTSAVARWLWMRER